MNETRVLKTGNILEGFEILRSVGPDQNAKALRIHYPDPGIVLRRTFDPPLQPTWCRLELAYREAGVVNARTGITYSDGRRVVQNIYRTGRNSFACMIHPCEPIQALDISLTGSAPLEHPEKLVLRNASGSEQGLNTFRRAWQVLRDNPAEFFSRTARFATRGKPLGPVSMPLGGALHREDPYSLWMARFDERPEQDRELHRARLAGLPSRPIVTIIADPDLDDAGLAALVLSLADQVYPYWELLIPRDITQIITLPVKQERGYPLIKNMGAPASRGAWLQTAISVAKGSFILPLRPNARPRPHCLLTLAMSAVRFSKAKLIYADEDELQDGGARSNPRFKPAWSPRMLEAYDYISDPCLVATDLLLSLRELRNLTPGLEFYDLKLRATDVLRPSEILHVAQVLVHGVKDKLARVLDREAARVLTLSHLQRQGIGAEVVCDPRSPYPRVVRILPENPPLVSILIPTRDRADLLRKAVGSIRALTAYRQVEIIVIDNASREGETRDLFESWADDPVIRVLSSTTTSFNYSELNNFAATHARGEILALVNNDIEVLSEGWLDEMVGLALQPGIGCVGAKLYYPDGTLQHGGVVTGIGGVAGHRHKRAARASPGYIGDLVTVHEVTAVTAACLVVRKSIFDLVGGFDEALLPITFSDVDLCLKIDELGYQNVWTPFAELIHRESVSRGRDVTADAMERAKREIMVLRSRWGDRLLEDAYYSPHLTLDSEDHGIRAQ